MSEKINCSLKEEKTFSSLDLTFTLLLISLGFLGLGVLSGCGGTPSEVITIRLLDEFASADVVGGSTDSVPSPPPTEWRFDGSASGPNQQWKAGPGVAGLSVRDGFLRARSTTDIPILHVERTSGLENGDVLHAIEVRMRASEGSKLAVMFSDSEELNLNAVVGQTRGNVPTAWPLTSPLLEGDSMQTYTLTKATSVLQPSFPSSAIRHIMLRPTDVAGAEIEIESVRLIFRKEYLANIPSGVSWQGFADIFRETLVTRSPERILFALDLPARPWLDLAVGTVEDGPVTFQVAVSQGGDSSSESLLLKHTVTTPHRWEVIPVDLADFAGERVTLSLSVQAEEARALGFWGSPVIRRTGALPHSNSAASDPPQGVILIIGDTLRRDHLDAYGYSRSTAPVLSRMAAEGVLFQDTQSQATWTKVSVPSILTSLYPTTHGIANFPDRMPALAVTIAEAFREAGYATWASSSVAFSGQLSNLHQGVEVLHERASLTEEGSKTARPFVDRLLPWLETHREGPFFVFLHAMDPHSPFEPRAPYNTLWADSTWKEEHQQQVDRAREFMPDGLMKVQGMPTREEMEQAGIDIEPYLAHEQDWYDGSIRGLDAEIGRVLEKLAQLGLVDKTLVAFISDHGEEFLEHGRHWHGNTVYGEMTNVPMILSWPGGLPAGKVVKETVQSIDLMPTLLELSHLSLPKTLQGQNLLPLLAEEGDPTREQWQSRPAFSERVTQASRVATAETEVDSFAIVTEGWKLIHNVRKPDDFPEYELFDHHNDPLNLEDLAPENPEVVERLSQQLEQWHEQALAARLPSDDELKGGLSAQELERLRSLGYIR